MRMMANALVCRLLETNVVVLNKITRRNRQFDQMFYALPDDVKELARKAFKLWRLNPWHPALEFKRLVVAPQFWSIRVGAHYRAICWEDPALWIWFYIHTHEDYNNVVSKRIHKWKRPVEN